MEESCRWIFFSHWLEKILVFFIFSFFFFHFFFQFGNAHPKAACANCVDAKVTQTQMLYMDRRTSCCFFSKNEWAVHTRASDVEIKIGVYDGVCVCVCVWVSVRVRVSVWWKYISITIQRFELLQWRRMFVGWRIEQWDKQRFSACLYLLEMNIEQTPCIYFAISKLNESTALSFSLSLIPYTPFHPLNCECALSLSRVRLQFFTLAHNIQIFTYVLWMINHCRSQTKLFIMRLRGAHNFLGIPIISSRMLSTALSLLMHSKYLNFWNSRTKNGGERDRPPSINDKPIFVWR